MALTPNEIREHVARMLDEVTQTAAARAFFEDEVWHSFIKAAVWYRNNGATGTLADRTEAMRSYGRTLFQNITGKDPAVDTHEMTNHWIDIQAEGEGGWFE